MTQEEWEENRKRHGRSPNCEGRAITSGYPDNPENIGNLPYGEIDKIITSPPYAETTHHSDDPKELEHLRPGRIARVSGTAGENPENIGQLPYGNIDSIITSPPYEGAMDGGSRHTKGGIPQRDLKMKRLGSYDVDGKENIGNLYGNTYLEAMLQVYQQCYKVLKPQGLMILVTKNFIRNKKVIRLDLDTIKLCEQAGFSFVKRRHRKLRSQSFWRIIYYQKHPDVPVIDKEDILVFRKRSNGKSDC
jgi:DNA modification methylase